MMAAGVNKVYVCVQSVTVIEESAARRESLCSVIDQHLSRAGVQPAGGGKVHLNP